MPFYTEDSRAMLYRLVKQANPSLPVDLSGSEVNLSAPSVLPNAPVAGPNTEIYIFPKAVGSYGKRVKVKYRRLTLDTLFRTMTAEIVLWTPKPPNASPFTVYQLLPYLNKQYGLTLGTDDVADQSFPVGSTSTPEYPGTLTSSVNITAKATSVGYVGKFKLRWVYAKRQLSDIWPITDVDGRLFPGGNNFDPSHFQVLNSDAFSVDFGDVSAHLTAANAFTGSRTIGAADVLTHHQAVIDYLNTIRGSQYTVVSTESGNIDSLYGASVATYVLPNANVPEANSAYYNRAVVITPAPANAGAKLVGKLILHFNI